MCYTVIIQKMTNYNTPLIKLESMEATMRILAYNTSAADGVSLVLEKDLKTIHSLAGAPYAWTEKQANLAMMFVKRYKILLEKTGFDVDELIANPRYDQPFRVISFEKSIDIFSAEDGSEVLEMKFPYNEKFISLIRCLKKKAQELVPMLYDGETKKWTMHYSDIVAYYVTLIAVRYDFKILNSKILSDYEDIANEKKKYLPIMADIYIDSVALINAPESLRHYWQENCESLPYIRQRDQLKQLSIQIMRDTSTMPESLAEKIAYATQTSLFVDRKIYDKKTLLQAMIALQDLPALCQFGGDIQEKPEILLVHEWLEEFKKAGIAMEDIAFGFEFGAPVPIELEADQQHFKPHVIYGADISLAEAKHLHDSWQNIHELSCSHRKITSTTKIIFVRNKIPKSLLRSGIRPKAAFVLQDNPMWAMGTSTLDRLVESLPKRLYYMSQKPYDKAQSV